MRMDHSSSSGSWSASGSADLHPVDLAPDLPAGEFTLAGWSPSTGVFVVPSDRWRPPLDAIYLVTTTVAGGLLLWWGQRLWTEPRSWPPIVVLGLLALVVEYFPVLVSHTNVSLGVGFLLAACLMGGPAVGAMVVTATLLCWAISREVLPIYRGIRGSTLPRRVLRPLHTAALGGLVYLASAWIAFRIFGLEAPVGDVTTETMAATVVLTVGVYLFNNLASLVVSAVSGENVRQRLKTVIPTPALVEFLALPAALLLVVTHERLGDAAFALLSWLYLMAAFLGWRSWMDRRSIRRRLADVELLHRLGATLTETLEIGDLVLRFRYVLCEVVRFDSMLLILRDATEGLSQAYAFDGRGRRGEASHEVVTETRAGGEGLLQRDDGSTSFVRDFGSGEAATLRLRLDFVHVEVPSDDKRVLLETVCQQAGTALCNAHLFRLANTDPLTGLASRRYFQRSLRSVAQREVVFSIIMLDLDRFKLINDRYGHRSGDAVLRDLAEVLKGSLRVLDIAGRYGGEEFVILLPAAASPEATAAAERIRRALVPRRVACDGAQLEYTASFGVADSGDVTDTRDPMEILWRADEALLEAKRAGRNQVVTYSSLINRQGP